MNHEEQSERYRVVSKYVPPPNSMGQGVPPGEHYTLVCTEPERHVGPDAYRHYSFYRTPKGSEVAVDLGYSAGTSIQYRLAGDGDLFRLIREAVERYDRGEQPSFRCSSRARKACCTG